MPDPVCKGICVVQDEALIKLLPPAISLAPCHVPYEVCSENAYASSVSRA